MKSCYEVYSQKLSIFNPLTLSFDIGNRINKINANDTRILCARPPTQSPKDYANVKITRSKTTNHKSTILKNNT